MDMRILIAGGTGLVGGMVVSRLATRPGVKLERLCRPPARPGWTAVDFRDLLEDPAAGGTGAVDAGVCCLGTTRARAGSDAAFRLVDRDYVIAFARAVRARGGDRFILVSSVGAGGNGLYLRTKGEAEDEVGRLGFASLDLLRPSLLLGKRSERRPAERLAQSLAPLLSPLLFGPLARYGAIGATTVADAVVSLTLDPLGDGVRIHEVPQLLALAAAAAAGRMAP